MIVPQPPESRADKVCTRHLRVDQRRIERGIEPKPADKPHQFEIGRARIIFTRKREQLVESCPRGLLIERCHITLSHCYVLMFAKVIDALRQIDVPLSFDAPGRHPEHPRRGNGINSPSLPPGDFVAEAMVVLMMRPAQRYCELVADLAPHCALLGEPQMMGISRASAANQTRLRCHELEMRFVTMPARFADRKHALIDFARSGASFNVCLYRR